MPDERQPRRLVEPGDGWERAPGMPLTVVFPRRSEQVAAHRCLENERVSGEEVLQPHREALLERCRDEGTVLPAEDTTTLNSTGLRDGTSGLGVEAKGSAGLQVHAAVAFTESRLPLGVSGLESWARNGCRGVRKKQARAGAQQRREAKESRRWWRGFEQRAELGGLCDGTPAQGARHRAAGRREPAAARQSVPPSGRLAAAGARTGGADQLAGRESGRKRRNSRSCVAEILAGSGACLQPPATRISG